LDFGLNATKEMTMAVARKKIYTPDEYLRLEERSETRHEFVNGEVHAMAGSTTTHNDICVNLTVALQSAIRKEKLPCRVYATDLRLRIPKANMYTYPDVMLICGRIEFDAGCQDIVLNPVVILEVLSESTSHHDHTRKFAAYRQIPSLQEYVMIDQARVSVEIFRRDKTKFWIFEALEDFKSVLQLKSVGIEIPLAAIYEGVNLEAEGEA
jgi:Uma2 family endonuclease